MPTEWLKQEQGQQILLVRREVYNVFALMTVDEFAGTEPYVEALGVVDYKGSVTPIVRRVNNNHEQYYPADVANPSGLFAIKERKESAEVDV